MKTIQKRILIFDDDENILAACIYVLQANGWTVHTSEDVRNVLGKTAAANPQVILMDNWIPETGGITATRTLKSFPAFRNIPVVYFSANTDVESLAAEAGADSFLAKPFNVTSLLQAVDYALTQALKIPVTSLRNE